MQHNEPNDDDTFTNLPDLENNTLQNAGSSLQESELEEEIISTTKDDQSHLPVPDDLAPGGEGGGDVMGQLCGVMTSGGNVRGQLHRVMTSGGDDREQLQGVMTTILCSLCKGYLIDVTTITECLHSFCRSCIIKYLSSNNVCPQCPATEVNRVQSGITLRPDYVLQELVYKLVPGLLKGEMERRLEFVKSGQSDQTTVTDNGNLNTAGRDPTKAPSVSVCLQLNDRNPALRLSTQKVLDMRYLLCPEALTVRLIRKFISLKFELPVYHQVSCYYTGHQLEESFTLGDVILLYGWTKTQPLTISYTVFDPLAAVLTRPRTAKQGIEALFRDDNSTKGDVNGDSIPQGADSAKCDPESLEVYNRVHSSNNSALDTPADQCGVKTPSKNISALDPQKYESPEYKITSVSNFDSVNSSKSLSKDALPAPKIVIKCKKRGRPRKCDLPSSPASKRTKKAVCKLAENDGKMKLIISSTGAESQKRKATDCLEANKLFSLPRKLPKLLPKPSPADLNVVTSKCETVERTLAPFSSSSLTNSTSDINPARERRMFSNLLLDKTLKLNINGQDLNALTVDTTSALTYSDKFTLQNKAVQSTAHSPSAISSTNCTYLSPRTYTNNDSIMNTTKPLQNTSYHKYKDNTIAGKSQLNKHETETKSTHVSGQCSINRNDPSVPLNIMCSPNKIKTDVTKTLFEKLIDEFSPKKTEITSSLLGIESDEANKKVPLVIKERNLCKTRESINKLGVSICYREVNEAMKVDCQKGKLHLKKKDKQGLKGVKSRKEGCVSNEGVKKLQGTLKGEGVYDFDKQTSDDNDLEGITVFNVAKLHLGKKPTKSNLLSKNGHRGDKTLPENNTRTIHSDVERDNINVHSSVDSKNNKSVDISNVEKTGGDSLGKNKDACKLTMKPNHPLGVISVPGTKAKINPRERLSLGDKSEQEINESTDICEQRDLGSPDNEVLPSSRPSPPIANHTAVTSTDQIPLKINVRWDSKEGVYVKTDQSPPTGENELRVPAGDNEQRVDMSEEKTGKNETKFSCNENATQDMRDSDLDSVADDDDVLVIDESAEDNNTRESGSIQSGCHGNDEIKRDNQPMESSYNSNTESDYKLLHDSNGDQNSEAAVTKSDNSFCSDSDNGSGYYHRRVEVSLNDGEVIVRTARHPQFKDEDLAYNDVIDDNLQVSNDEQFHEGDGKMELSSNGDQANVNTNKVHHHASHSNIKESISDNEFSSSENRSSPKLIDCNLNKHVNRVPTSVINQTDSPPHAKIKRIVHPDGSGHSNLKVVFSLIPKPPKSTAASVLDTPKGVLTSSKLRTCLAKSQFFQDRTVEGGTSESSDITRPCTETDITRPRTETDITRPHTETDITRPGTETDITRPRTRTINGENGSEFNAEKSSDNDMTINESDVVTSKQYLTSTNAETSKANVSMVILNTPNISTKVKKSSTSNESSSSSTPISNISSSTPIATQGSHNVPNSNISSLPSCPSVIATPLGMFASPRISTVVTPDNISATKTTPGSSGASGDIYDVPVVIGTKSFLSLNRISSYNQALLKAGKSPERKLSGKTNGPSYNEFTKLTEGIKPHQTTPVTSDVATCGFNSVLTTSNSLQSVMRTTSEMKMYGLVSSSSYRTADSTGDTNTNLKGTISINTGSKGTLSINTDLKGTKSIDTGSKGTISINTGSKESITNIHSKGDINTDTDLPLQFCPRKSSPDVPSNSGSQTTGKDDGGLVSASLTTEITCENTTINSDNFKADSVNTLTEHQTRPSVQTKGIQSTSMNTTEHVLKDKGLASNKGPTLSNQGLTSSNQGPTSSNQGLTSSNQGLTSSNQGLTSSSQGLTSLHKSPKSDKSLSPDINANSKLVSKEVDQSTKVTGDQLVTVKCEKSDKIDEVKGVVAEPTTKRFEGTDKDMKSKEQKLSNPDIKSHTVKQEKQTTVKCELKGSSSSVLTSTKSIGGDVKSTDSKSVANTKSVANYKSSANPYLQSRLTKSVTNPYVHSHKDALVTNPYVHSHKAGLLEASKTSLSASPHSTLPSPTLTPLIPSPAFFTAPYFPLATPPFTTPFLHPMLPLLPLQGIMERSPEELYFARSPMYDRSHVQDYYGAGIGSGLYPHTPETPLACRSDTPLDYSKHSNSALYPSNNSGSKAPGNGTHGSKVTTKSTEDKIRTVKENVK